MIAWFTENWGTILISLVLIGIVSSIVLHLRNKKKQGLSSCGCNCSHCTMGGACHQK